MSRRRVEYDFKTVYDQIDTDTLGMLRLDDVNMLISMTKLHLVKYPREMYIFFEALKNAMEIYYPRNRKKIDFFGKFDYKVENTRMDLDGKIFDFKIKFVFYSIIGYGISPTICFDFDGNFFVLGNNVEMGWTDQ